MTIKSKIALSNVMMVLLPLFFTAVVIFVCLNTSLGSYWHTLESMYNDENGIQFAKSMIYTYQQELWENNWGREEQNAAYYEEIRRSDEMNHLEDKLSGMGYHFMIEKNGSEIYSNLSEMDVEALMELGGEAVYSADTLTASRNDISIVKNTFYHGDKTFCILAVRREQADQGMVNYLQHYILRYIAGIAVFFVLLTLIVNSILSWWISRSILKPLNLLKDGSCRIREGDLDQKIRYNKKDEFGEVCQDFDNMRKYLKESVELRQQDEKRRKDLIAGISHDLRTPLTSVCGYVDGLLDGLADTPEKQERYLKAIKTRTGNLVNLVESLSEYSRLDRGYRYHMERTDLRAYMETYLENGKHDAVHDQVQIDFQMEKFPCIVDLDHREFKRVLENLFDNTVKYRTAAHSDVLLSFRRTSDCRYVEFIYQDDGPGVPEESLEAIFDSFYRVDDSRNQSEKGSGLGLAVVKEIIRGHHGTIRAENRGGLAIIICLPLAEEDKKTL